MAKSYVENLLGDHEKIQMVARQHWFTFVQSILVEILFIIVILIFVTVLLIIFPAYKFIALGYFLLIIPFIGLARDYVDWSSRQYIITNFRVIQIWGIVNKNVIDSSLEKVNDVKMDQSFFGRIFNYGDIEILTASELAPNLFKHIGNPVHFKTSMLNAKERLEHEGTRPEEAQGAEEADRSDIPALIEQLHNLRQRGVLTEDEFQKKKADLLTKM
jgi:uncharacterized membrane protein YdbT with pleckstrin-like domain